MHSEYPIVDGIVRIDEAVAAAAADRMPALALTDLANVFGLVKFYQARRASAGVKPIVRRRCLDQHECEPRRAARALLLAQSRDGLPALADWLTRAHRENQHRGPRRDAARLDARGHRRPHRALRRGDGEIGHALPQGDRGQCRAPGPGVGRRFSRTLLPRVQRAGHAEDEALVAATVRLASELACRSWPPIRCSSCAATISARTKRGCASPRVRRSPIRAAAGASPPEQYFKSQAEMAAAFADYPEALANTVAIAQRCNLAIPLGKNTLPDFPTPAGVTIDEHLRREAATGLEKRLAAIYPDPALRDGKRPEYEARLEFEAGTIVQMGFAGYFLIVADFINWAKANGVPVGPGRGSGAGSLVAYALGITDLDPLRYALLFERFLNPERVSMPDFDIDFCQDGRDRVIDYVKQRYGADSVSQIATFGTMAAKAAVRDVGRVLDLPYVFCDGIAKLIPFQPGKQITLKEARAMEPLLAEREKNEEEVRALLALAEALEGLTRNVGMHAGGVLIAPGKLTDFCPLYMQAGIRRHRLAVRQGRRGGGGTRQVRLPRPHHPHHPRLDAALRPAARSRRSR